MTPVARQPSPPPRRNSRIRDGTQLQVVAAPDLAVVVEQESPSKRPRSRHQPLPEGMQGMYYLG